MGDKRCERCTMLYDEEDLLLTEDTGEWVCPECSGLFEEEKATCRGDEEG